jgi:adenylosuccinate lyase
MRAWKEGLNFRDLILQDQEITRRVPQPQIERAFDLNRQLGNIDKIFARVFENDRPDRVPKNGRKKKRAAQ